MIVDLHEKRKLTLMEYIHITPQSLLMSFQQKHTRAVQCPRLLISLSFLCWVISLRLLYFVRFLHRPSQNYLYLRTLFKFPILKKCSWFFCYWDHYWVSYFFRHLKVMFLMFPHFNFSLQSLQDLCLQPVTHNFKIHSDLDPPCLASIPLHYFGIEGYRVKGQCKMTLKG